tara:strand:+ start:254 stop:571 length:318 start_codon:yes stop_codon:yes gene_type:complete
MNKEKIGWLVRRQEHLVTRLTDDQDEFLDMLEEFYEISTQLKKPTITNDSTRDIAIRIMELLESEDVVRVKTLAPEHYKGNDWDWDLQDLIHDIINKELKIKEEK